MYQQKISFFYEHPLYTEYGCDDEGNVYSFKYGKIKKLKPFLNNNGYLQFEVWKDGKTITHPLVHKVVYECIKGDIPTGYHVDHLDFNRQNNSIENLRVLPASENRARKSEEGKKRIGESAKKACSKPVLEYTLDFEFVKEWASTMEIQRELGYANSNISACCRGKCKQAYGKIWRYKNEEGEE